MDDMGYGLKGETIHETNSAIPQGQVPDASMEPAWPMISTWSLVRAFPEFRKCPEFRGGMW